MPRIPSPANFSRLEKPSTEPGYPHPASARRGVIPMAFQVTSPFNRRLCLMPHALVLHVNPATFSENPTRKVERIQTRGGFVEQHWGDELTEISADGSTGAFVNIYTGTSSVERQRTIAWDRYRDLFDLYYNNGSVYDPFGNVVLQGNIMLMYDKGTYIGSFRTFSVEETGDSPFTFNLSWTFKVEETLMQIPLDLGAFGTTPAFQRKNKIPTKVEKGLTESPRAPAEPWMTVDPPRTNATPPVGGYYNPDSFDTFDPSKPGGKAAPKPTTKVSVPAKAPTPPAAPQPAPPPKVDPGPQPVPLPPGPIIPPGFEAVGKRADGSTIIRNPITGETRKVR